MNQEIINKQLRERIESDKQAIKEGRLRPAPTFPSETITEEELLQARNLERILYLNLEFTNLCNLGCTGCFNYYSDVFADFDENRIHPPSDFRGELLSHGQVLDVITQAADFGAKSIDLIGGGEPLSYKRFMELVEHSRRVGLEIETFSNGTLITEDIAIDEELMEKCGIIANEKVLVVNITNGERWETYAIPAKRNSRTISPNGGGARLCVVGDILVIMSFAYIDPSENITPKVIILNEKNEVIEDG